MALILATSHDFDMKQSIVHLLARTGHEVILTSTVEEAVTWLEESDIMPDLILADVGLRTFGGREFIVELKSTEKWRQIPIVVQTKSQQCEVFDFCEGTLLKPYTSQELVFTVNLVLGI